MTDKVPFVADAIEQVRRVVGRRVQILVGGRPFNLSPGLWREVGADASASDARAAVERANLLVPAP